MNHLNHILFVSAFNQLNTSTPGRAQCLINAFKGYVEDITFITTDFDHGKKHPKTEMSTEVEGVKCIYLHVTSYKNNLSLSRIKSHIAFSIALNKWLNDLTVVPELIYCSMPTSTSAYVCGKYCKKTGSKLVIDVIDIWPNSLIPIMPMRNIFKVILLPWQWVTNRAYKMADYISAESQEYAEIAHQQNTSVPWSFTYLGVDEVNIEKLISESKVETKKEPDTIYLCYAGSLGNSYDFDSILRGVECIKEKGMKYKMLFIGDGEKRDKIEISAREKNLNVEITGFVSYCDLLKYLSVCDIAFNSFAKNTLVVHSYKFNDYLATGLYIMNNLKGETADIIEKYDIGCNFDYTNIDVKLLEVINNWNNINPAYKNRISKLVKNKFSKPDIYNHLRADILNKL